jgi:iron complex outermembrane receptor protein
LQARASGGENTTFSGFAMVSAPISDNAGVVLSFDYDRTDGFFRNSFLPSALNTTVYPGNSTKAGSVDDAERWNINGRLVFNPTDATEIDLKARYGRVKSGSIAFNAVFQIPTLATVFNDPVFNIDVNDHAFLFTPNIDPNNDQKTFEASAKLKHDFGWAQLNGYVSYSNIKNDFFADGTSGAFGFFANEPTCVRTSTAVAAAVNQEPFERFAFAFGGAQPYSPSTCDGTQYQRRNQEDISVELRLSGTTMDTLSWQLGAYYLRLDRDVCVNLGIDTGRGVVEECFTADARNPTEALADDSFRTNVYALFGSLDYDVTDQFKIGLALRYDIEERGVSNNVPTGRRTRWVGNVLTGNPNGTATTPANYFLNPGLDPVYNPSGRLADRDATFKQLQPKISLSYALTPTHNLYANWGIGFKSGGFNSSGSEAIIRGFFNAAFNAGLSIFDQYDKERTSAFELGVKGSVLDGRVTYEVAGYYTDVKDMQFFEFFVGPFGLLRVVSNIDKVELYGAEFSTSVRIIDGWSVFGSANVTDSKIKANGARPNTVGNKSPYTSDYTINLGTQATLPITDGINGTLRVDWRLTGPTWFHTIQDNTVPNIFGLQGNFSNSQRDSYSTVNLRAGLEGDYWTVSFVANNLFDKKFLAEVIPAPEFGGDFISPGGRRFIGAEVGVKF